MIKMGMGKELENSERNQRRKYPHRNYILREREMRLNLRPEISTLPSIPQ